MSAPYSNLPAPRFAPPKPSPLSQNTSFLSSDPPTAGPSNSTDTNHPTGGGGGAGGGGSSKKKRHYHHHHGRKESQSAGGGGDKGDSSAQPQGSNKRKRDGGGGGGGPANAGGLTSTTTVSGDATPAKQFATQIVKLVDALKQNNGPMNLSDLEGITGVRGLLSEHTDVPFNQELYDAFNAHDRVILSDKGKVKLWSYRPDYSINSPQQVLELLKRYQGRGGMSINKLKESWPSVQTAIDDLESSGKVYVLRTESKGGQPKTVLYNPVAEKEDLGSSKGAMDDEFQEMFKSLATPASHLLTRELLSAGLSTTAVSSSIFNPLNPTGTGLQQSKRKKGRGQGGNRRVKLTNTHLGKEMGVDLSKDYTPDGPAPGPAGKKAK